MSIRNTKTDSESASLTPAQASRIAGISTTQLARMASAGKLTASKPGGTHRRYVRAEILALAEPVSVKRTTIVEALEASR